MRISIATILASMVLTATLAAQSTARPGIRPTVVTLEDGTAIHVLQAGTLSTAPTVVFIPGWTLSASMWTEQIQKFSRDRLVIAIDSRSQGDSSKTDVGNTPERRAQDLREVLSSLHVSNVVLVGWSQGAQDVAAFIQQFGTESVDAVAFVDSPVAGGPSEIESNRESTRRFLEMLTLYVNHPGEYSEGMVRSMFKRPHPDLDVDGLIAQSKKTPVTTGVTMLVMDLLCVDRRPALAKLHKPTLVIGAADSPTLNAQRSMAALIPESRFVIVPNAGHALFVDDPGAFDSALEQLLESVHRSGSSMSRRQETQSTDARPTTGTFE